eukprot:20571-Heterococcus_DN1.PRE.1
MLHQSDAALHYKAAKRYNHRSPTTLQLHRCIALTSQRSQQERVCNTLKFCSEKAYTASNSNCSDKTFSPARNCVQSWCCKRHILFEHAPWITLLPHCCIVVLQSSCNSTAQEAAIY